MAKPAQILKQSVPQAAVGQLNLSCHFWHLAAMASMPSVCHDLAYRERASVPLHSQNAQELKDPGMVSGCLVPSDTVPASP